MQSDTPKLRKIPLRVPVAAKTSAKKDREVFTYAIGECSFGAVLAAFSEFGLVALMIGTSPTRVVQELQDRFAKIDLREDGKTTARALAKLITFIEKPATKLDISLDVRGTPFQRRVWEAVSKIPAGQTSTYSDLAEAIGAPKAMRAVGTSCTNNLFTLIIPCHRVLSKGDGFAKASKRQQAFLKRDAKIA